MDVAGIVTLCVLALAALAIAVWFAWGFVEGRRDEQRVREAAIPARARILDVKELEIGHLWLELELHVEGAPPRTIERSFNAMPGKEPRVGQWIRARIHPDDASTIFLDDVEP